MWLGGCCSWANHDHHSFKEVVSTPLTHGCMAHPSPRHIHYLRGHGKDQHTTCCCVQTGIVIALALAAAGIYVFFLEKQRPR
jgi:hypothetical protein